MGSSAGRVPVHAYSRCVPRPHYWCVGRRTLCGAPGSRAMVAPHRWALGDAAYHARSESTGNMMIPGGRRRRSHRAAATRWWLSGYATRVRMLPRHATVARRPGCERARTAASAASAPVHRADHSSFPAWQRTVAGNIAAPRCVRATCTRRAAGRRRCLVAEARRAPPRDIGLVGRAIAADGGPGRVAAAARARAGCAARAHAECARDQKTGDAAARSTSSR